ncbi:RNA polymerase sigma factor [Nocardioides sp. GCM10027113]|uniref:RNA polymerase sigma factor n=1 Tax=unclassified Nocardioides TaxID=2615069 RepID=UPI00361E6FC4
MARTGWRSVVEAACAGEEWAFAELWREYSPRVQAFVRARGASEPDDLTSEVFLQVLRRLPTFEGDESDFRAFLFTVARCRLVDELRRRSRQPLHLEWAPERDGRSSESAEALAMRAVADGETARLMDELTPDQREVIALRVLGELTVEEVARVTDRPAGAVKALQRRGLDRLRRLVRDQEQAAGGAIEAGGRR